MKLGLAGVVALSFFFVVAPTRAQPQAPFGGDDPGCVPDTKAHLTCSNTVVNGFAQLITSVAQCHRNQADAAFFHTTFDEATCTNNARAAFEATVAGVAAKCPPAVLSHAAAEETLLLAPKQVSGSLDNQNAAAYCNSRFNSNNNPPIDPIDPSGDDAGFIPPDANGLKCADGISANLAKLLSAVLKCHTNIASSGFRGGSTDDESCENAALSVYDATAQKLAPSCSPCAGLHTCPHPPSSNGCPDLNWQLFLAHNATQGAVAQVDGANGLLYPCPTTTTTSTTCPPQVTTTTCPTCAGASLLNFTTGIGTGSCGTALNTAGGTFKNLACGGLYTGGGGNSVPLPETNPDYGPLVLAISSCSGTSMTLSNTTACQTGSNHICSSAGCLYGPPLPIPNALAPATSVCVVNTIAQNAAGSGDCSTGDVSVSLPLSSELFLVGDLYPNAPGIQVCPVCNHTCTGGSNDTGPCNSNADCPSGGTCGGSNVCHGGPSYTHNGPCMPNDTNLGSSGPTSFDCPPDFGSIGTIPIAYALTTGTTSKTAVNNPGVQNNVFCGFCRDPISGCFDGGPVPPCPSPSTGVTACTTNADCPAAYQTCQQRNSGAFGPGGGGAHTITETGAPGGDLRDAAAHASTVVSVFCIPPTFNGTVDSTGDLPAPGAVALEGSAQLK